MSSYTPARSADDSTSRATPRFSRFAVLGLGLIGGSMLRAAGGGGVNVVGFDPDETNAEAARMAGFEVAANEAEAVRDADLVLLAMPLTQMPEALAAIAPAIAADAVVTDVGTLKAPVHELVRKFLPDSHFVGGHPLAGTEESGFAAADPLLFRSAPWALTLEFDTEIETWLRLAELICDLGAKPVPTTVAAHDAAIARVIGLPHVLAEALALTGLAGGPLGLSLAAGSYMSGSRVARTRPELVATWCDGNPSLVTALDDAIAHLTAARETLANDGSVLELAIAGHDARIDWEHREFEPVELRDSIADLLEHGRLGGWITAILPNEPHGVRLLGMRPRK
ncbi:prephenate dehydrogenase [Jatrophihabitans sp. GAS493]|uniref:prephenate dehydrogenase/arogenate dehydrogenase family protein n=1 Tax=Jatrophihabitans sp. GAS493 TaxID=1907575 RepID=UPI000BB8A2A7|nr:prephenate dehydrogenase/arogenate dehydrogenase family protein [Jatrophihabitans sp. GAS493]SOD71651.1 prephenate dehydrogenase [Jatrophihabitans sp. GAS493]